MSLDYLSHFGLSAEPFSKDIGDADLWLPPCKLALVDDLTDAMHARASALLTGEPGVGKTCVLRALRHALAPGQLPTHLLPQRHPRAARLLPPALPRPRPGQGHHRRRSFFAVSAHVEDLAKERVCPVFLLDEAHLLHQDTLDHLHILLNYPWDSKPLLSLVLVGLPDLEDRLRLRRNRSLYSRLHHRFCIGSLSPDDTADYLRTRLARVGATKDSSPPTPSPSCTRPPAAPCATPTDSPPPPCAPPLAKRKSSSSATSSPAFSRPNPRTAHDPPHTPLSPSADDVDVAPQLLVVALADAALLAVDRALDSAHPILAPDPTPRSPPTPTPLHRAPRGPGPRTRRRARGLAPRLCRRRPRRLRGHRRRPVLNRPFAPCAPPRRLFPPAGRFAFVPFAARPLQTIIQSGEAPSNQCARQQWAAIAPWLT